MGFQNFTWSGADLDEEGVEEIYMRVGRLYDGDRSRFSPNNRPTSSLETLEEDIKLQE